MSVPLYIVVLRKMHLDLWTMLLWSNTTRFKRQTKRLKSVNCFGFLTLRGLDLLVVCSSLSWFLWILRFKKIILEMNDFENLFFRCRRIWQSDDEASSGDLQGWAEGEIHQSILYYCEVLCIRGILNCMDELKVRYTGVFCIIVKYCVFEVFWTAKMSCWWEIEHSTTYV